MSTQRTTVITALTTLFIAACASADPDPIDAPPPTVESVKITPRAGGDVQWTTCLARNESSGECIWTRGCCGSLSDFEQNVCGSCCTGGDLIPCSDILQ